MTRRGFFGLAGGIVLILSIVTSCGRTDAGSAATGPRDPGTDTPETAIAVEALEVSRGTILETIEASGTVRGVREVDVVSEVEGQIVDSPFVLGQRLEEGDTLVTVQATLAELQLQEARGDYETTRIDLSAVERRFENGSASQIELTRARSAADGARARLRAAEKTYNDHTIRTPIDGLVASRFDGAGKGNYLSAGTVVARVVDLSELETEITVGEEELLYLRTGVPAVVTLSACDETEFEGTVTSIAAGADPLTGSFPVIVRWENRCDRTRSGMSVTVSVEASESEPDIVVPDAAIRRHAGEEFVFVVADGTVAERTIVTGRSLGDRVAVTDGLREGEVIVTSGLNGLRDGTPVEVTLRGKTGEVL